MWRLFLSSAEFSKNHMHVTRNQARNEGGGMSGRSGLWTDDELANRKKRSSLSSSLSLSFRQADRRRLPHSTANDFLSTKTIVACPTRRPQLRSRRSGFLLRLLARLMLHPFSRSKYLLTLSSSSSSSSSSYSSYPAITPVGSFSQSGSQSVGTP